MDRLPACVDVTLPLLDAKISFEDHSVPNSVKAIFMAAAIQRWVFNLGVKTLNQRVERVHEDVKFSPKMNYKRLYNCHL